MGIEHKITGVFHLIAISIIIFYLLTTGIPKTFALIGVLFFVVKGIGFAIMKQNPLSLLDAIVGIYFVLPILGIFSNEVINVIFILFLLQKGLIYLLR